MNWLKKLITGGVIDSAAKITEAIGKVGEGHLGKKELELEVQKILAADSMQSYKAIATEMEQRSRMMIAELNQGDLYTKRARPTVVYSGIVVLAINHVLLPWISHFSGQAIPVIEIPAIFWGGWSGIVATWSIGRDVVRRSNTASKETPESALLR